MSKITPEEEVEMEFAERWKALPTSRKTRQGADILCKALRKEYALPSWEKFDSFVEKRLRTSGHMEGPTEGELVHDEPRQYRLSTELASGGEATVFLATDESRLLPGIDITKPLNVAIRFLRSSPLSAAEIGSFRRQVELQGQLRHQHLVPIFNTGVHNGRPYVVMEYVPDALPIDQYCMKRETRGPLSVRQRLELMIQLCDVVQCLNVNGCVHRDLKPANVLVSCELGVKLIDLGLAHLSANQLNAVWAGTTIGTFNYLAPEQITANVKVNPTTDVYSLSVILFELLTGSVPLQLSDASAAHKGLSENARDRLLNEIPECMSNRLTKSVDFLEQLAEGESVRGLPVVIPAYSARSVIRERTKQRILSDCRSDLDWIVKKGLQKRESARYKSAEELAADLKRYLANEPLSKETKPSSLSYVFIKKWRREPKTVMMAGSSVVGLLVTLIMAILSIKWQNASALAENNSILAKENAEKTASAVKLAARENDLRKKTAAVTTLLRGVAVQEEGRWQEGVQLIAEAWNSYPENDRRRDGILRYLMNEATQEGTLLNPIPIITHGAIDSSRITLPVVFNADGTRMLIESRGCDGGIELWSTGTSQRISKLCGSPFSNELLFTPDGRTIVGFEKSEGATVITEYDALTGQKRTTQQAAFDTVKHLSFSSDGKSHFIVVKRGDRFEILDRINGRSLGSRELESDFPEFRVSDSGNFVVTLAPDGICTLWNLTANAATNLSDEKHFVYPHGAGYRQSQFQFSPDSKRIAVIRTEKRRVSGAADKPEEEGVSEAALWDTENGLLIAAWGHLSETEHTDSTGAVWDCGFNSDGTEVQSYGTDMHLQRRSAATGELLDLIPLNEFCDNMPIPLRLAFEPNPSRARLTDQSSTEIRIDASVSPPRITRSSVTYERLFIGPENDRIIHFYPANKWVFSSTPTGKEISRVPWGYVHRGGFSPDGWLFARPYKGGADIWKVTQSDYATNQADEMRLHGVWDNNEGSRSDSGVTFSPDATLMAFWIGNVLRVADLSPRPVFQESFNSLRVPVENNQILEFSETARRRIDLRSMKPLQRVPQDPELKYQSHKNDRILASDNDGQVFLLSADTLEVIAQTGNSIRYSDLLPEFSPDGDLIHALIFHDDLPDSIGLWSSRSGKLLRELKLEPTADENFPGWKQVQFASNGQAILATDHAGRFSLWKSSDGKLMATGPASESETEGTFLLSADSEWFLRTEERDEEILITRYSALTGASNPPLTISGEQAVELMQTDASWWLLAVDSRHLVTLIKRKQEQEEPTEYSFHFRVTDLQTGQHRDSEVFKSADAPEFRDGSVSPSGDLFAVVTTTGAGQKLWTVNVQSIAIQSRDLDKSTWIADGIFYVRISDDGAAVLTENQFGQYAWDTKTLKPLNAENVPVVSDGAFSDRFPLNLRPWGADPFVTLDEQGKLIDLGNGLPVDWRTSLAPANTMLKLPAGVQYAGAFSGGSVMDSEMPNWAFPFPPETRLHEPFVKLISTIPEIPEVIDFNQMNEQQLAEMEQREAAWQEILRDPAGQKWISDLEAAFLERSWYRSHALAEVCLLSSDWPAAAFHLTKAIEKNPSDRESIRLLMEANCITGRIDEAGRNLEQLRGSNSDERIIGIEAHLRLAAGDVPGCQKILDRHPEVQALDELSSCLKGQPEAVASRVEVLRKFPDSKCESKNFDSLNIAKEFIICALALNELGRTEDARKQLMSARDEFQREIDSRTLPYAQGLGKWQIQTQIKHLIESAEAKLAVP